MSLQPDGEKIRNAVKWIGQEKKFNPEKSMKDLIEKACLSFNLSPLEAEFLERQLGESPPAS